MRGEGSVEVEVGLMKGVRMVPSTVAFSVVGLLAASFLEGKGAWISVVIV